MNDKALIESFEDCTLPSLSHVDHVRLAYLYLRNAPLTQVLSEFPTKLRAYAESKGEYTLYHETITWAYLVAIHERMRSANSGDDPSWQAFTEAHPELLESSFLERYYSKDELESERARRVFVLPRPR